MSDLPPSRILRSLLGIADIEALLKRAAKRPNFKWSDEWDEAQRLADTVSRRLFGLSLEDTKWSSEGFEIERDVEFAWERQFLKWSPLDAKGTSNGSQYALSDLGWDVSDGHGQQLLCAELFYRPLVCVAKDIAGHEAGAELSDEELRDEAEEWAAGLLAKSRYTE